ncbi:MAG: pyruvate dehydrogenase (acetyl-transferring) E1 component subunit alpha [Kiloniellales bacterium]
MPQIASFRIECSRLLNPQGHLIQPLPEALQDPAALVALYKAMVLTRSFDAKAVALQRTGRLGTYASSLGQEAVAVAAAAALRSEDVFVPSFRDQGGQLFRGVSMTELLLYWGGDERGSDFAVPRQDLPICVPVGTQVPQAAGVALAFKLRGEARVALCLFGDGATSRGDVYEAMNFAALQELPLVLVINNNQWAISVPRTGQTAAKTLAQKAIAAGMPGRQVDGNDALALAHAIGQAVEQARAGGGPTLIEALTYRLSDHTTADDARRYRDDTEVSARWKEEPIARLRQFLTGEGHWTKRDEEALLGACAAEVESAVEAYLNTPALPPSAMFDHLYAELPSALRAQRDGLVERGES